MANDQDELDKEFGMGNAQYPPQPDIQKNFSVSSDLFEESPMDNRGIKRDRSNNFDDFGDDYKRFKS